MDFTLDVRMTTTQTLPLLSKIDTKFVFYVKLITVDSA